MNIVQALTDPKVLGFAFGAESWRSWRAILAGAFGLPLEAEDAATFERLTGRKPPGQLIRELSAIAGRRSGKSSIAAAIVIYLATLKRWTLSAGEVGTAVLLAADRDQARISFRYCLGLLEQSPILKGEVESTTADTIRLRNGIEIVIVTSDKATVRGRTIIVMVADELMYWGPDADEVLRAARPGMASQPEAMLVSISTAYRRQGAMYETFRRSYGLDDPRCLVVRAATRDLNLGITQAFIDEELARDATGASAEYLSEFRGDISAYVDDALVDAAIPPGVMALTRAPGVQYYGFADASGGGNTGSDAFSLAVAHQERGGNVVLDKLVWTDPPFVPEQVVERYAVTLSAFGVQTVHGDRWAGEWPASMFRKYGITYTAAQKPKSDIYLEVLPLFASRKIQLLDHQRLSTELRLLERKPRPSGRGDQIEHGPRGHDDLCNSALGACWIASTRPVSQAQDFPMRQGVHIRGTDYDPYAPAGEANSRESMSARRGNGCLGADGMVTDSWGRRCRVEDL